MTTHNKTRRTTRPYGTDWRMDGTTTDTPTHTQREGRHIPMGWTTAWTGPHNTELGIYHAGRETEEFPSQNNLKPLMMAICVDTSNVI